MTPFSVDGVPWWEVLHLKKKYHAVLCRFPTKARMISGNKDMTYAFTRAAVGTAGEQPPSAAKRIP